MKTYKFEASLRSNYTEHLKCDLAVVGGGLSGVCAAISAAREGIKVILIQDRPVLGGNASSEVRLWVLGATSHMGNNNRWSREGGLIDEILTENVYRNKEGNSIIFDTILIEKVREEKNITLLLNTNVYEICKENETKIKNLTAFCSQNSTKYIVDAPLFCDASGDGIVAFQSGSSFRMGAESSEEFDEGFAPDIEDYGELLGHSLYFYTKDVGKSVKFTAPSYAIKEIDKIPAMKRYRLQDQGCWLWWVEYGGRLDTIHETEHIKFKLWSIVYGIWHYVKNSGNYPDAETLTLEWVGNIPGKRESRRFMGDYILTQKDVIEQRKHYDAVAFGGWSLDLHPADGFFGNKSSCNQWHSKGIYQIPYRCYYSKDIDNLFLSGRIISASHVAFGSSRVMATCAHGAQAVGIASAIAIEKNILPKEITSPDNISLLQKRLNVNGQSIHNTRLVDKKNKVNTANIRTEQNLVLSEIPFSNNWKPLIHSSAQLLPLKAKTFYSFEVRVKVRKTTSLKLQLRVSSKSENYTPDTILEEIIKPMTEGTHKVFFSFSKAIDTDAYAFVCFMANDNIDIGVSNHRITGIVSVFNSINKSVSNFGKQDPPKNIGVESFEFWIPERRPKGENISMKITPPLSCFNATNLNSGFFRPYLSPNAFVAPLEAKKTTIHLNWDSTELISNLQLVFDTDFDHAMESSLLGHPENVMPFCVRNYVIKSNDKIIYTKKGNYQSINRIKFDTPIQTSNIQIVLNRPSEYVPCALFEVLCY